MRRRRRLDGLLARSLARGRVRQQTAQNTQSDFYRLDRRLCSLAKLGRFERGEAGLQPKKNAFKYVRTPPSIVVAYLNGDTRVARANDRDHFSLAADAAALARCRRTAVAALEFVDVRAADHVANKVEALIERIRRVAARVENVSAESIAAQKVRLLVYTIESVKHRLDTMDASTIGNLRL